MLKKLFAKLPMLEKPTVAETQLQHRTVKTVLPILLGITFLISMIVLPTRYGLDFHLLEQRNFRIVLALLMGLGLAYGMTFTRLRPVASTIVPLLFFGVGFGSLGFARILSDTPFVPFYAQTVAIVTATFFLSLRQLTVFMVFFTAAYGFVLANPPFPIGELLHRMVLVLFVTPFAYLTALVRHATFKEMESQTQKVIEASNIQTLAELSGSIAHEINNPLAIITGHCNRALRLFDQADFDCSKFKDTINKVNETAFRISKIIVGLKRISRIENKIETEHTTVGSLVDEAVSLFSGSCKVLGIDLKIEINNYDEEIECHAIQIVQVIINLLKNAMDAVEPSEHKVIVVRTLSQENFVRIDVTDTGVGIPQTMIEKISSPFFTTKPRGKGTGLGLSLCKRIVSSHRGTFTITSEPGATKFSFTLPSKSQPNDEFDEVA